MRIKLAALPQDRARHYVEKLVRREDTEIGDNVVDLGGPSTTIKGELIQLAEHNVVTLVDRVYRDYAADCQNFYDGLRELTVALEKSEPLQLTIESRRTQGSRI